MQSVFASIHQWLPKTPKATKMAPSQLVQRLGIRGGNNCCTEATRSALGSVFRRGSELRRLPIPRPKKRRTQSHEFMSDASGWPCPAHVAEKAETPSIKPVAGSPGRGFGPMVGAHRPVSEELLPKRNSGSGGQRGRSDDKESGPSTAAAMQDGALFYMTEARNCLGDSSISEPTQTTILDYLVGQEYTYCSRYSVKGSIGLSSEHEPEW